MDRAEATGLSVAVVGHVVLLAALTYGLARATLPALSADPIEVSFVDNVDLTSASPEPAAPAASSSAPDIGPPEEAVPEPTAEPPPLPARRQVAPTPAPSRTKPPEQTPTRQRQTARRQSNLPDPGSFGSDPAPSRSSAAAQFGPQERASMRQMIARALMPCQRQPLPAPEAAAIKVDFRVTLNRDGSLAGAEFIRVINPDPSLAQYERRMRDLALNVINGCTPIRGLPPQFYDVPRGWRQFPYQFDPRSVR